MKKEFTGPRSHNVETHCSKAHIFKVKLFTYIKFSTTEQRIEPRKIVCNKNISHSITNKHEFRQQTPAYQYRGLGSIPGEYMWDLWWAKWHWDNICPRTSVSPSQCNSGAPHSIHSLITKVTLSQQQTALLNRTLNKISTAEISIKCLKVSSPLCV